MSKWEMVKLGDVGEAFIGLTYKPENVSDEGMTVLRSGNIQNNKLDYNDVIKVNKSVNDKLIVQDGDILICSRNGSKQLIGKAALLKDISEKMTFGAFMMVYRSEYNRYLIHFIQSPYFRRQLFASETTTINQITKRMLDDIQVPFPEVGIQKHIADTLDKTQEIIDCHKKQLEELDNLIKATFYDMFGDPVTNEMGWNIKACIELAKKIGSGATPKGGNESYKDFGISLIRSLNVHNGYFKYEDLAYIDEEQADKLRNVIVEKNDVLLNITGASVARSCVVPSRILPARVNQHVVIIRPDSGYINSIFLNCLFTNASYQQKLWKIATGNGATREAITKQQIESLDIILPPIELQNRFADIVTNIEAQKAIVKQSITESQNLFNSLMSKYFD